LKSQDSAKIDKIVHRIYEEVIEQIDCTKCGNCCNSLRPSVTKKEIVRLSKIDNLSFNDFVNIFVEKSDEENIKYLKDTPCKYLKENKCIIYSDRPEDCKSYPHIHKKDFNTRTLFMIENLEICPIAFNVYERLKSEMK
jgi:uncharacterized protein